MRALVEGANGDPETALEVVLARQHHSGHFIDAPPSEGSDQYHAYTTWLLADGRRRGWLAVDDETLKRARNALTMSIGPDGLVGDRGRGQRQVFGQAAAVAALAALDGALATESVTWRRAVEALLRYVSDAGPRIALDGSNLTPGSGWYDYNRWVTYVAFAAYACARTLRYLNDAPLLDSGDQEYAHASPTWWLGVAGDRGRYPSSVSLAPTRIWHALRGDIAAAPGGPFGSPYGRRWADPAQGFNVVGWMNLDDRIPQVHRYSEIDDVEVSDDRFAGIGRIAGTRFTRVFTVGDGLSIEDTAHGRTLAWGFSVLMSERKTVRNLGNRVDFSDGLCVEVDGGRFDERIDGHGPAGPFTVFAVTSPSSTISCRVMP